MFRLIRWLCFPIARRLNTWPMLVFYALAGSLVGVRTWFRGGPEYLLSLPAEYTAEMDPVLATWLLPAVYTLTFIIFPVYTLFFDRRWWQIARAEELSGE